MALIASLEGLDATNLRVAIQATFRFRNTHPIPTQVPDPPASWIVRYRRLADEEGLPWKELPHLVDVVKRFLNPVLAGEEGQWDPADWRWVAATR